jgi:hypothetical protein
MYVGKFFGSHGTDKESHRYYLATFPIDGDWKMKIARKNELLLVNYLKTSPFLAVETPIQYGIQFTTASGVIVNFHYSDKAPLLVSITVQRDNANVDEANMIRHFAQSLVESCATSEW